MEIQLSEEARQTLEAGVMRGLIREAYRQKLLTEEQYARLLRRYGG